MKWYAYKDLEDSDKIKLIACEGDAESMMKQAHPDKVVSGAGTEGDPYVYAATAELMGELAKDADGAYIQPDSYYRSAWEDNAGSVVINLSAARAEKKAKISAECKELCAPYREAMLMAMEESDAQAESDAKAAIAAIKAQAAAGHSAVDAESDLSVMKDYNAFA